MGRYWACKEQYSKGGERYSIKLLVRSENKKNLWTNVTQQDVDVFVNFGRNS